MREDDRAEPLYGRAVEIAENVLGPDQPELAGGLHGLALVYQDEGKYDRAEALETRALEIGEKALGPDDRFFAWVLQSLGSVNQAKGIFHASAVSHSTASAVVASKALPCCGCKMKRSKLGQKKRNSSFSASAWLPVAASTAPTWRLVQLTGRSAVVYTS